ncbi:hemerythrin domain-containing protein, partial [Nocardioides sp.]|uniref:hemerythrin domain-containing protein n=1 Tax=Nocardioides sp. TaxID=35761 RepID=UPI0026003320
MNDLMVASTAADARAAEAMVAHHAAMAGTLTTLVSRLTFAARSGRSEDAEQVRAELVAWCRADLVPHALAEEAALYPVAAEQAAASLLVTAMITEHQLLLGLVEELEKAGDAVTAAVAAGSLRTVFESHLGKENDLLVPLLATAADASLADLLEGMHEELEQHAHHTEVAEAPAAAQQAAGHGHGHGGCGCGESDAAGYPELDVRTIPHA